jgi:hypothetical protein
VHADAVFSLAELTTLHVRHLDPQFGREKSRRSNEIASLKILTIS